ncbi:AAA family ATPase [Pedobacter steynii]
MVSDLSYTREKLNLFNELELLVIDEVSMVRCDLLDVIDTILRSVRKNTIPFGGVQLLLIGDLYQLPPVTKRETGHF